MEAASEPKTLQDAIVYFSNPDSCLYYLAAKRWPNGVTCPKCGSKDVIFLASLRRWKCRRKHPVRQFSVKVGTVMEDSPIALNKWLTATWQVVNCKNGISSYEVHRRIGITQKSAWFLDRRIRFALGMRISLKKEAKNETTTGTASYWQHGMGTVRQWRGNAPKGAKTGVHQAGEEVEA
jgi:transposase-like protein